MRGHSPAWRPLVLSAAATGAILATIMVELPIKLVWNASESAPIGLYRIAPADRLEVTQLVLARPPAPLATYLTERGYVGAGVPLLKRVAALSGQTVCRDEVSVTVDGAAWAVARERDRMGRLLPAWQGCRTLTGDEVFLLNWDAPASFDGRYFGPLSVSAIIGRATAVWTFEDE